MTVATARNEQVLTVFGGGEEQGFQRPFMVSPQLVLKMGWAAHAIDRGVERAHIIDCEDGALLEELFTARRGYGTCISQDDYEAPHPEDMNDDLSALSEMSVMEQ